MNHKDKLYGLVDAAQHIIENFHTPTSDVYAQKYRQAQVLRQLMDTAGYVPTLEEEADMLRLLDMYLEDFNGREWFA